MTITETLATAGFRPPPAYLPPALKHDAVAFIGRYQIFHNGHLSVIERAFEHASQVIIGIGSARSPRSHRNPFTFSERSQMITESIAERNSAWSERLKIVPLDDMAYNDEQWITHVHQQVYDQTGDDAAIALIGHSKDASSYYLHMFPNWDSIPVANYRGFSATPMRNVYFSNIGHLWLSNCDGHKQGDLPGDKLVPTAVKRFLEQFFETPEYQYLAAEYDYILRYRMKFAGLEFPPIFVTVDACVVQSGHVLLVKRKSQPGKGLWALPGGFVLPEETILHAMLRELREETKIKVPEPVLRGSIITTRVFDDPFRSARGRTITHASLIHLRREGKLPNIRGSDDAEKAKWWPIGKVQPEQIFEDHFSIITSLVGLI